MTEFESLLREHDRSVRSVAWRLVGTDVDDVLQQAYLKAFLHWQTFRGDSAFGTWLHRIVYTTCLDHLRGTNRRDRIHRLAAVREQTGDRTDQVIDHVVLDGALADLPEDQRTVLLLVDGQGFSYDDAAHVLDVAPGTIASRLSRARAAVRARLTEGDAR